MGNRIAFASFDNAKFNNRLAYLINTLSVLILLFCASNYAVKHWFTVNKIIIQGDIQHITPVQLSYIAQNRLHGTFFTLDIVGLKGEFQQIPWVRQVSLKRHFPHTIEVNLVEYKVLARIGDDALLAENGEVFDGADDNVDLPVFYVAEDKTALALAKYHQIEAVLNRHADKLQKLWLNSARVIHFQTTKKLNITICDAQLDNKLAILDQYWNKLSSLSPNLTTINLCYKNAIAIDGALSPLVKPATKVNASSAVKSSAKSSARTVAKLPEQKTSDPLLDVLAKPSKN